MVANKSKPELCSAVMITGKSKERLPLARQAVKCFIEQSYPERELVVINDGEESLGFYHPYNVYEFHVARGKTLGELRNLAFQYARGAWMLQWDDDDFYQPGLMSYMMENREPGAACLLRWQVRCSLLSGAAFYYASRPGEGIHGTILHEKSVPYRYPAMVKREDTVFLSKFPKRVVLDNHFDAGPDGDAALYVRMFHGCNTWDERHIMLAHSGQTGVLDVRPEHVPFVTRVIEQSRCALGMTNGSSGSSHPQEAA